MIKDVSCEVPSVHSVHNHGEQVGKEDGEESERREKREVCCERESPYEDIDLAPVGALVNIWETAVVDKRRRRFKAYRRRGKRRVSYKVQCRH